MESSEDTIRRAMKRGRTLLIVLLIGIGLAVMLLYRTDMGAMALNHLVENLRPLPLIGAFLAISMAFFFMALRWRALMPPEHNPPALGLSSMICTGLLLNYTAPGPVGALGAAWFAHRRYEIPLSDSLASGLTARLVGLATAGSLATLAWSLGDLSLDPELGSMVGISQDRIRDLGLAMGGLGMLAVIFILRPAWWAGLCSMLLRPLEGDSRPGRVIRKGAAFIRDLGESVDAVRSRGLGPLAWAGFWALCGHSSVIIGIWTAASSLGAHPSLSGIVFTYATATSLVMALFAFPGSQLGWDLLFGGLLMLTAGLGDLSLLGQPEAYLATVEGTAAAIVLLVRVQQLCFMLIGAAAVAWLLEAELLGEPTPPD